MLFIFCLFPGGMSGNQKGIVNSPRHCISMNIFVANIIKQQIYIYNINIYLKNIYRRGHTIITGWRRQFPSQKRLQRPLVNPVNNHLVNYANYATQINKIYIQNNTFITAIDPFHRTIYNINIYIYFSELVLTSFLFFFTSKYSVEISITVYSLFYLYTCLLYTSPSPRDGLLSRMPSSA